MLCVQRLTKAFTAIARLKAREWGESSVKRTDTVPFYKSDFFFVKNTVALRFFSSAGKQVCLCSKAKGEGGNSSASMPVSKKGEKTVLTSLQWITNSPPSCFLLVKIKGRTCAL